MISHKHQCIFTHVPKTGGKSILATFGLPMLGSHYGGDIPYIESPYGHVQLSKLKDSRLADYFCFAFVRNPFDRLVSAFFYMSAGGCNKFDAAYRDKYLSAYKGDFLAFVEELENHIWHDHFRPQIWWLTDDEGVLLPDFIGRYESLEKDYAQIKRRLGVSAPELPSLNTSDRPPTKACYTELARRKVAQVYGKDFAYFAYDSSILM